MGVWQAFQNRPTGFAGSPRAGDVGLRPEAVGSRCPQAVPSRLCRELLAKAFVQTFPPFYSFVH